MNDLFPAIIGAAATMFSSCIGCISTIIITAIGGWVINSILSKQESQRESILSQQNPSFPSYFNDTRRYIQLIGKLKRAMLEFYFDNSFRAVDFFTKFSKNIIEEKFLGSKTPFLDDNEWEAFKSQDKKHSISLRIYRAKVSIDRTWEHQRKQSVELEQFYDSIPLLIPSVYEIGQRIEPLIVDFQNTPYLGRIFAILDNDKKEIYEIKNDFLEIWKEKANYLDSEIEKMKNEFRKKYYIK